MLVSKDVHGDHYFIHVNVVKESFCTYWLVQYECLNKRSASFLPF